MKPTPSSLYDEPETTTSPLACRAFMPGRNAWVRARARARVRVRVRLRTECLGRVSTHTLSGSGHCMESAGLHRVHGYGMEHAGLLTLKGLLLRCAPR